MTTEYKFKGGDKVSVNTDTGMLSGIDIKSFSGTVVAAAHELPVVGMVYVVVADDPKEAGLQNPTYPFPGVLVSENHIVKLTNV